jgi:hypothetical protein
LNATSVSAAARRGRFKWYLLGFVAALLALAVLYTMFMLWWSYSDGERAGVLQKFSQRGWVCKTHEGELALYVVAGVAPQIWNFSVRDAAVAEELGKAVGQSVRLHYREHRGLPTSCFGETDYFVDRLEVIGRPPVAALVPAQAVAPAP